MNHLQLIRIQIGYQNAKLQFRCRVLIIRLHYSTKCNSDCCDLKLTELILKIWLNIETLSPNHFSKYNSEAIKGNQIVQIEEQLNIGRTTILKITIDNKLILEFIANPNEEFLSQKAEEAIQITKKYFKDLEKLKNRIEQY